MFDPGRTMFSIISSAGSTPGDMNRTVLSRIELAVAFGAETWGFGFRFWFGRVGFERRVRKERVKGRVLIGGRGDGDKKEVICRVRRRFLSNIVWDQMQSNRESARRSRMRKQQHLDDLTAQVTQLRKENNQILTSINITTQHYMNVESENSVLKAQMAELSQRLESLNEILGYIDAGGGYGGDFETTPVADHNNFINPWNMLYVNQPIMATADMLDQYY